MKIESYEKQTNQTRLGGSTFGAVFVEHVYRIVDKEGRVLADDLPSRETAFRRMQQLKRDNKV